MEVEETQTLQYYSIFLGKKMNSNQPDKDVQYKSVDGDGFFRKQKRQVRQISF